MLPDCFADLNTGMDGGMPVGRWCESGDEKRYVASPGRVGEVRQAMLLNVPEHSGNLPDQASPLSPYPAISARLGSDGSAPPAW